MELSRKAMAIADSVTLAIDAKAKAMAAEGTDVVGFGAGERILIRRSLSVMRLKRPLMKGKHAIPPYRAPWACARRSAANWPGQWLIL